MNLQGVINDYAGLTNRIAASKEDGSELVVSDQGLLNLHTALKYAAEIIRDSELHIFDVVQSLHEARINEMLTGGTFADADAAHKRARNNVEQHKKTTVARAYANGVIEGKNVKEREANETMIIANDETLPQWEKAVTEVAKELAKAIVEHDEAKIERKFWEDLFTAHRAVLYSSKPDLGVPFTHPEEHDHAKN